MNEIQLLGLTPRPTEVWTVLSEARYSKTGTTRKLSIPPRSGSQRAVPGLPLT